MARFIICSVLKQDIFSLRRSYQKFNDQEHKAIACRFSNFFACITEVSEEEQQRSRGKRKAVVFLFPYISFGEGFYLKKINHNIAKSFAPFTSSLMAQFIHT